MESRCAARGDLGRAAVFFCRPMKIWVEFILIFEYTRDRKGTDVMNINTNTMVPISVANQNFSKVAKLVDQFGSAVIMKNNAPRYIIYEFNQADAMQAAADDDVLASSRKLMERNKHVYEELAK